MRGPAKAEAQLVNFQKSLCHKKLVRPLHKSWNICRGDTSADARGQKRHCIHVVVQTQTFSADFQEEKKASQARTQASGFEGTEGTIRVLATFHAHEHGCYTDDCEAPDPMRCKFRHEENTAITVMPQMLTFLLTTMLVQQRRRRKTIFETFSASTTLKLLVVDTRRITPVVLPKAMTPRQR